MRLQYVYFTRRRGAIAAVLKYPIQALLTIIVLFYHRPQLVFIQDPPTPAGFVVWLCGHILRLKFIIDTHTQRHQMVDYPFLLGMRRFVAKRALTNIVTNETLRALVESWDAPALVMEDLPLPIRDRVSTTPLSDQFNVVWVNNGASDEPRDVFFEAVRDLPMMRFYVTSDYGRNAELREYQDEASANVEFTGHLPDAEYYQMLKSADAVLTMTTRDFTLQQGACEAMWLGTPVITSDWSMLRAYFTSGAVFVDNTVDGLRVALQTMQADHAEYVAGIQALAPLRHADWDEQVEALQQIVYQALL